MLDSVVEVTPFLGCTLHSMSVNLIRVLCSSHLENSLYVIHGSNFAAGVYSSNQWRLKLLLICTVQFF